LIGYSDWFEFIIPKLKTIRKGETQAKNNSNICNMKALKPAIFTTLGTAIGLLIAIAILLSSCKKDKQSIADDPVSVTLRWSGESRPVPTTISYSVNGFKDSTVIVLPPGDTLWSTVVTALPGNMVELRQRYPMPEEQTEYYRTNIEIDFIYYFTHYYDWYCCPCSNATTVSYRVPHRG
jgi:hypothetical protein